VVARLYLTLVQPVLRKSFGVSREDKVNTYSLGTCVLHHVCDYDRPSWNGSTKTAMHSKFCPEQEV
jgi:hypothetical protein